MGNKNMKHMKSMIIASIIAIIFNACSSDSKTSPITIEIEQAYNEFGNYYFPKLIITSLKNQVELKDIKINKGNCKFTNYIIVSRAVGFDSIPLLPKKLNEFQELEVSVDRKCRIKVVDIVVDNNSWSFTFE